MNKRIFHFITLLAAMGLVLNVVGLCYAFAEGTSTLRFVFGIIAMLFVLALMWSKRGQQ